MISDTHKPYGRMLGTLALGITLTILLVFAIGRPAGPALADTDAPDAWTEAAELPLPLGTSSVQCYDDPDGFYLVGGLTTGNVTTNTLYHYDAATNIWDETLAPMLEPRRAAALACYEGKIYAAGGWDSVPKDSFYIYDIVSDTWSPGPTLPNVTWGAALGAWDGKLYLVGGSRIGFPYTPVDRVDVYDLDTGMWTADGGDIMPTASGFYGAVQRGPYLFAVGGISGDFNNNVNATQRYDMSTDTWEAGPTFTSQRALIGLSMTESRLYASGGDFNGGGGFFNPSDLVEYLELADWPGGAWTDLGDPLPLANLHPAGGCTEAMTGGEIWAVGGTDMLGGNVYSTTLYRPAEPCFEYEGWVEAADLPIPLATWSVQCSDDPDGFYVVGGLTTGNVTTDTLYHYDAASNNWDTTLAPMPEPRRGAALACYEGKIYAAGGWETTPKNSFYIYDIAMDSWSVGPTLPDVTWGAALGAWDGKLYMVGGTRVGIPYTPVDRVDLYDIDSGVWTPGGGAPMPVASGLYGTAQRGPYLFAVGGLSGNPINVDATQRYDMSTDTWEAGPTFTSQRALGGLSMTGARLYAMGGKLNGGISFNPTNLVEYLELADWPGGAWIDLGDPLPVANLGPAGGCTEAMTGGEIWAIGGVFNSLDNPYTTTLYRPAEPCFVPYAVSLTPESASAGDVPGAVVTYDLTVTNLGDLNDTYTVTVGESGWTITVSANTLELGSGLSETLQVTVTIPIEAPDGIFDMADITVTSHGDPDVFASSTLTTTSVWYKYFLPVMQKNYEVNP